MKITQTSSIHS